MAATAIVAGAMLLLTSLPLSQHAPGASHYSSGRGTPGPAERARTSPRDAENSSGEAPWALSALLECFRQLSSARGTAAFVRGRIPGDAHPVPSGATLRIGDCVLAVLPDEIRVARGPDRLRIPPHARLFTSGRRRLVLDRRDGRREEVRVYALEAALP